MSSTYLYKHSRISGFAETLNANFLPWQLGWLSPVKKAETLNLWGLFLLSDFVKNERNIKYKRIIKDMIEGGVKGNTKDRLKKAERENKKQKE